MARRKLTKDDIDGIVQIYTTRNPDGTWTGSVEIGRQFGVSDSCIRYHLHKRGIETRSLKEAHAHGKACRPPRHGKTLPPKGEHPPLCKCGCGQRVKWNPRKYRWNKYVKGHYHKHRPYHEKSWLQREYVEKGRSTNDIAEQFDVTPSAICKAMDKLGVPRRTQAESLRLSGAVAGPNNPAWNGGVANWEYASNWKSLCKIVKDRDEWTCQLCGEQRKRWGHDLHVHHIDEDKTNNHPHNLISLCKDCHHPTHGNESIRPKLRAIAKANTKDVDKYIW